MLKITRNNPYRFLGICSNASTSERLANTRKLNAFLKVNKELVFPLDLANLMSPLLRTIEGINAANNSINLPKDQLKYALFWFVNSTPIDKMALEYLQNGNTTKALELFGKRENFSSLLNKGVLAFLSGDNGEAIQCITKVIHDDGYREALILAVCGSSFQIDEDELAQLFINTLLSDIKVEQLRDLFEQYGVSSKDDDLLREKSIDESISSINTAVSQAKTMRSDDAHVQYQTGVSLMNSTKSDLLVIRSILETSGMQYQMVADNLAKQILQCGINYYTKSAEEEDVKIEKALTLQNYALSISVGKLMKDRCKENVDILNKNKQELPPKEVRYYDKCVKEALVVYMTRSRKIRFSMELIENTVHYLMSIKEVLGGSNTYYLRISTLIVNASLRNIIEEFNGIMNEGVQIEMLLDREGALRKIRNVFEQAWKAILYMDKLDMEPNFKRGRYNQNRNSLKEQVEQFINVYQTVDLDMRGEMKIFNDCRTVADCNNYIRLFPGGKYVSQVKDKLEKIEFDACKTIQDCHKFQLKYPHSSCPINDRLEECCYNKCNTISDCEGYLKAYPNGRYRSQVKASIDKISYDSCRSISDYKQYMKNFPYAKYFSQAKLFVDDEEMWQKCSSSDSKDLYKKYLETFPNGRHKSEAEQKVNACYVATMVYGDYNHPQVVALRGFRDSTLQNSVLGRRFILFYYKNSPAWVEYMKDKKCLNKIIRVILNKFIELYDNESR